MLAAVRTNANKYHALRCSTLGENWMEDVPIPVSTAYKRRIGSQVRLHRLVCIVCVVCIVCIVCTPAVLMAPRGVRRTLSPTTARGSPPQGELLLRPRGAAW
eukprot:909907-Rhodomonas_salina.2